MSNFILVEREAQMKAKKYRYGSLTIVFDTLDFLYDIFSLWNSYLWSFDMLIRAGLLLGPSGGNQVDGLPPAFSTGTLGS